MFFTICLHEHIYQIVGWVHQIVACWTLLERVFCVLHWQLKRIFLRQLVLVHAAKQGVTFHRHWWLNRVWQLPHAYHVQVEKAYRQPWRQTRLHLLGRACPKSRVPKHLDHLNTIMRSCKKVQIAHKGLLLKCHHLELRIDKRAHHSWDLTVGLHQTNKPSTLLGDQCGEALKQHEDGICFLCNSLNGEHEDPPNGWRNAWCVLTLQVSLNSTMSLTNKPRRMFLIVLISLRFLAMCFAWSFAFFDDTYNSNLDHLVCFQGDATLQHHFLVVVKNHRHLGMVVAYSYAWFYVLLIFFIYVSLWGLIDFSTFWSGVAFIHSFSIISGGCVKQF